MTKLERLKREGREAAERRGHIMTRYATDRTFGIDSAVAHCKRCGKGVFIDTHPAPNSIDIGGEAGALGCED